MMKRVFLDTNIMLDLAMHREHFDAALAIMKGAYEGVLRFSRPHCRLPI